jgi:glutamine synthetase
MNEAQVLQKIKESHHQKVKFAVVDIDGVLRGKVIHKQKFLEAADKSIGFCNVVFGWDVNDACYDNSNYTGWHSGYPDMQVCIDLSTYRTIPWENDQPFFLAQLASGGQVAEVCSRSLLSQISRRANLMGFTPMYSVEYEWFNFKETPESLAAKHYLNPAP